MEAISHAGTVLAVLSKEGVVLAAEKVSNRYSDISQTNHPRLNTTASWAIHFSSLAYKTNHKS